MVHGTVSANTEKELTNITVPESGTYLLMVYCYVSSPVSSNLRLKLNGNYWWDLFYTANTPCRPMFVRPIGLAKGDKYSLVLEAQSSNLEIQTPSIILTRLY